MTTIPYMLNKMLERYEYERYERYECTGRLEPFSDRIRNINGDPFVQQLISDVVVAQVFCLTAQTLIELESLQATLDSSIFNP